MYHVSFSWMGNAGAERDLEVELVRNVRIIFGEIQKLLVAKVCDNTIRCVLRKVVLTILGVEVFYHFNAPGLY